MPNSAQNYSDRKFILSDYLGYSGKKKKKEREDGSPPFLLEVPSEAETDRGSDGS
jgi:hypothetical protein